MKRYAVAFLALVLAVACQPANYKPTKTGLELQSIQTKEFETNKKIAFASVLSVFLDLGYIVTSSDLETGYIAAKSPTQNSMGFSVTIMKDSKATAFIEEIRPGRSKVRLGFVDAEEWVTGYGGRSAADRPIEDETIYNNAFNKINEAIFIRMNTGVGK